jgi:S1-C subfamily serine protease
VTQAAVDLNAVIRRSVVMLETEDADGTASLGTGFLMTLPAAGRTRTVIVTNYHVLSSATSAYARFHDQSRHAVIGYRAIAPELDLAAVELASLPGDAQRLTLADEELKVRAEVVSVGHPQGIEFSTYPGEVSTLLQSTGLPASAREYLRRSIRGARNLLWIQHTARISPGNSGGPLLNGRGQVAGVNTWTNHEVGFSYALHARQLRLLLANPLAEVAPLTEYTSRQALAAESRGQLSAENLETLLAEVEAFGLVAGSTAQYRKLQELAVALTYASKQPEVVGNSARQQQREAMVKAADKIATVLRNHRWDTLGATTLVNDLALEEYRRPLAGVFLFAVVERVVAGREGTRGMLLQVAGSKEQIFIPLEGLLIEPAPGTQLLIVGMNFQGQVVRYGENPLDLTEVPVIVTGSDGVIELGK